MTKRKARRMTAKCPNPLKGTQCFICGGTYLCLEPWRKKRTNEQRISARQADAAKRLR